MNLKYWDRYTKDTNYEIYSKVIKLLPKNSKIKILDVGCGSGEFESLLKANNFEHVIGVDISKKRLEIAKRKNPKYIYGIVDIENGMPFKENVFDYVIAIEVLEHVKSPYNLLKEMLCVSKSYIILTTPNAFWVELRISPEKVSESVFHHITESDLKNLVKKFNVKIECFDYVFGDLAFLRNFLPRYFASKFIIKLKKEE